MDRNNKMVKLIFASCMLLATCFSCIPKKISENEIFGVWKNPDGAELTLYENKTFILEKFNTSFCPLINKNELPPQINGKGEWKITKTEYGWVLDLFFDEILDNTTSTCYEGIEDHIIKIRETFQFDIVGENGFFENRPPWYLRAWESEPWNSEIYEFHMERD